MRTSPYVNADEGQDFMILTAVHGGLARLAQTSAEVLAWQEKFLVCREAVKAIMDERLGMLDCKERKKAEKRFHNCVITSGGLDFGSKKETNYTVPQDDLLDCLNEVCEKYCYGCGKAKWRSCEWRRKFDHMGIFAKNEGPKDRCPYRVDRHVISEAKEEGE